MCDREVEVNISIVKLGAPTISAVHAKSAQELAVFVSCKSTT